MPAVAHLPVNPLQNCRHVLAEDDPALQVLNFAPLGQNARWLLRRGNETGGLELCDLSLPKQRPLRIEFGSSDIQRRIKAGRQQHLAKACGLHVAGEPLIVDLTAGLGRDAWCLAALGARVHAYERQPLLYAMLHDALRLARTDSATRISLHHGDGRAAALNAAQVVFIDPMFPSQGKRAAPGLEMQILQQLVGADEDAQSLLDVALASPAPRIVLKRPPRGSKVRIGEPDLSFGGGRVVYDVYLNR